MSTSLYLTTTDNPHSPITEFDRWLAFDREMGYNTCGYLNREVERKDPNYDSLSQDEKTLLIHQTIREIAEENILGIYMIIHSNVE